MKGFKFGLALLMAAFFISNLALFSYALHGDVNYDESISIEDAVIALRFATGIQTPDEYQEHSADLDYDGEITTNDVRLILRGAADIDYVPDHFFSDWEIITAPTCTQDGLAQSTCYYCQKKVNKILGKTEHNVIPATCDTASYCSVCNETLSEPLEHIESEGYCINCKKLLSSPALSYNNKEIGFGCSSASLKSILGEPQNKYKDSDSEKTIVLYVYYTDYTDLAIFTFTDGNLTQFFSNATTAKVMQGNTHYGLYCKSIPKKIGDINLTVYSDTFNNSLNYSFCATVGENYNLKETTNYTLNEKIVFHLTNGLRAINGLNKLKYCSDASEVAKAHSTDMATNNFWSHNSPNGKTPGNRLDDGGINWTACSENIVAGYYDPYGIANGWYNSELHRKNILNSTYQYVGIGFAYNEKSDYKYYGTQDFYA